MNNIRLFNLVSSKLLAHEHAAKMHSCCKAIPDDTPHCFREAWLCMNKLLQFTKPTDSECLNLLRFMRDHTDLDTMDLDDLSDYFAEVHDVNYSIWGC